MSRRARIAQIGRAAALAVWIIWAPSIAAHAAPERANPAAVESNLLHDLVVRARREHQLIALGAVVASSHGVLDQAVDGQRSRAGDDPAGITDPWHIGSNTKALSALLYGQLVQLGLARWGATIPELFPDFATELDPAWRIVTIEDLFAHRTGMMQMGGFWLNARRQDTRPVSEQRREAALTVLSRPPQKDPAQFDYNNLNYIVAGAAMEGILQAQEDLPDTWEAAMQALIFTPLADRDAAPGFGFGPPPEGLQGHRTHLGMFTGSVGRGKTADNPAVLGPAGTLHATLHAHATLAAEFLKSDSALVPPDLREKLFSPHPDRHGDYAMGWGVRSDPKYGKLFIHSGSNTAWYSRIIIAPDLDRVVIVNTNQFGAGARAAAQDVTLAVFNQVVDGASPE